MFAILCRSSLALPTAEGDRSPLAGRETTGRETRKLPEKTSRILLGKYLLSKFHYNNIIMISL